MEKMRLSRYLATAGVGSRRFCDSLITSGKVTVNGACLLETFVRVSPEDYVAVAGKKVTVLEDFRYYLLYKPRGYVCSMKTALDEKLAVDLIETDAQRLFSIGRLDKESEGLIIFTNDGQLTHLVEHPDYGKIKTYLVTVLGAKPTRELLDRIEEGVVDKGELLKPLSVVYKGDAEHGKHILKFRLDEGKNREIRRICRAMNWRVRKLQRVAIGSIELAGLKPGEFRTLRSDEVEALAVK